MKKIFGIRYKTKTNYYEKHHIIPRSLNGSDEKKNLVLLTAKEHYLCHWLLVKRFEKDTVEHKKMLKAWFMMSAIGDTNYYLDGYDSSLNIAFEYDEKRHYNSNGELNEKDLKKMNYIKEKLNCRFFRYNESLDELKEF